MSLRNSTPKQIFHTTHKVNIVLSAGKRSGTTIQFQNCLSTGKECLLMSLYGASLNLLLFSSKARFVLASFVWFVKEVAHFFFCVASSPSSVVLAKRQSQPWQMFINSLFRTRKELPFIVSRLFRIVLVTT